jgi:hypothetical protein
MTTCVSDESLVEIATGEGTGVARAHLRTCRHCAERAAALSEDLRVVRHALLEGPLPTTERPARWAWLPAAGALATAAVVALVWAATPTMRVRPLSDAPLASLASDDVSLAVFDASERTVAAHASDSAYVQAALNGGWPCGEDQLYGVDCGAAETVAFYTE